MLRALDPFRLLLIAVAGWMNQHQLLVIDYLREENRILREQLGGRRLRFTDGQRRRLAAKAKGLGRKLLAEISTIVTAETLLASKADRPEVRRQWEARTGTTADGRRTRSPGRTISRGEPGLGVSAHPGSVVQSGSRNCPQHDCRDSLAARDRAGA